MNTAFSAGTVMGPAIGGALSGAIGVGPTFLACGGAFAANALGTRFLMSETLRPPLPASAPASVDTAAATGAAPTAAGAAAGAAPTPPAPPTPPAAAAGGGDGGGGFAAAVGATLREWGPLWRHDELRGVFVLNGAYWFCLSGNSMTLLPLMLTSSERFGLGAAEVGALFAMQSAIAVVGAMPAAALADRLGPANVLAPSLALTSGAMWAFPLAAELPHAVGVLCVWALGGVLLGSAPTANAANLAPPAQRAQAIALMRTTGDLGLLSGAVTVGSAAALVGHDAAMQGTAAALLGAAGWYGARRARAARAAGTAGTARARKGD